MIFRFVKLQKVLSYVSIPEDEKVNSMFNNFEISELFFDRMVLLISLLSLTIICELNGLCSIDSITPSSPYSNSYS